MIRTLNVRGVNLRHRSRRTGLLGSAGYVSGTGRRFSAVLQAVTGIGLALLVLASWLAMAGPAAAAPNRVNLNEELAIDPGEAAVAFRSGGRNDIVVSDAIGENRLRITDQLAQGWTGLSGCGQLSTMSVLCGGPSLPAICCADFTLSDGADRLQVELSRPYAGGGGSFWAGEGGNDTFLTGRGGRLIRDQFNGGEGADTVSYLGRPSGVVINGLPATIAPPFDVLTSGEPSVNERDLLFGVEVVTGTDHDDTFVPDGGGLPRVQSGRGGNDSLAGTNQASNTLDGGTGADVLRGDLDDDGPASRDRLTGREPAGAVAQRDQLFCGPGSDIAVMDLQDTSLGCEDRQIAAVDEGGILTILSQSLRRRAGRVAVRLNCPRSSKTHCHGRLTISANGRRLGSRRYRLDRGERGTVGVRIQAGARGQVTVLARERDSKGRPKTSRAELTLR